MKKMFIASLLISQVFAQQPAVQESAVEPVEETDEYLPIAESSFVPTEPAPQSENQWQNWVFAASALVTVTVGVLIISMNKGTTN